MRVWLLVHASLKVSVDPQTTSEVPDVELLTELSLLQLLVQRSAGKIQISTFPYRSLGSFLSFKPDSSKIFHPDNLPLAKTVAKLLQLA